MQEVTEFAVVTLLVRYKSVCKTLYLQVEREGRVERRIQEIGNK